MKTARIIGKNLVTQPWAPMWKEKTGTSHTEPEGGKGWEQPLGGPPPLNCKYTYARTLWMMGTFPQSRGSHRPQTILSKDYFMTFQGQFKGCLILTTCSSHEGFDSSSSGCMTRTSCKIRLTICTIGSSGECGTFQWDKRKYYLVHYILW